MRDPRSPEPSPLIRSLSAFPEQARGGALAIGNFDGLHRGHRHLLSELRAMANRLGGPSIVFTFDPPPLRLLRPEPWPMPLTTMERRSQLLRSLGVDFTIAYPTDRALLALTAVEFFERILIGELGIGGLVEGPNFRFGRDRMGDVEALQALCGQHARELTIVEPQQDHDKWYSSSVIREWLEQGEVERANRALMEPYRISGIVRHGAARGRTLGYPTANLEGIPVLVPGHGVYAGRVLSLGDSNTLAEAIPVALNIGPNPTFGEGATKVEAHLIGYSGDLYGQLLEIELLERVRAVQKFASKEELLERLKQDVAQVESICRAAERS